MEDALHSAGSEDFVEGEEGEEDESEKSARRFLAKHVATEDELGVPRDDRLVEIEEDIVGGGLHLREV